MSREALIIALRAVAGPYGFSVLDGREMAEELHDDAIRIIRFRPGRSLPDIVVISGNFDLVTDDAILKAVVTRARKEVAKFPSLDLDLDCMNVGGRCTPLECKCPGSLPS